MRTALIAAIVFAAASLSQAATIAMDDIQFWTGTGSNQAVMAVQWNSPEVFNNSYVPAPVETKTMVWGYRFDGTKTGEDMFNAILAADPHLYAMVSGNTQYGKAVFAIGYDLNHNGVYGMSDGVTTYTASSFTNGLVGGTYYDPDYFTAVDGGDLYWGGWYGPNWELWQASGLEQAPDRGADPYWTSDGTGWGGTHGQWAFSGVGMSGLTLQDGSWMGWSVSAGGLDFLDPDSAGTLAWMEHKQAPDMTAVPEPATLGLLAMGGLAMLGRKRRK